MMLRGVVALATILGVNAHGYLSSPLPRSAIPTAGTIGPKTPLVDVQQKTIESQTWTFCNSSNQPDLGKGSRGYAFFQPGSNMTMTWTITLPHADDANTGIGVYWRNNSDAADTFQAHNIFNSTTIPSGGSGNHSMAVPIPDKSLTDATLLWLWISTDGGYYFGCADFQTATLPPTAPTTVAPSSATNPTLAPSPASNTTIDNSAAARGGEPAVLIVLTAFILAHF